MDPHWHLGEAVGAVEGRLAAWRSERVIARLWERDPSLWPSRGGSEVADRLGWLDLPRTGGDQLRALEAFTDEVVGDGIDRVVLLGMGGSSLAPEVFQRTFGSASGRCRLEVLDSTHPSAVAAAAGAVEPRRTLFIVSSKSGTTVETSCLFRFFWHFCSRRVEDAGRHFVAITDPGTPLEKLATERGFRQVFIAPADVGGRFSALSVFGLVPAALIGADLHRLLDGAAGMAEACSRDEDNPAARLAAALAELALAGRDKLTLVTSPGLRSLPDWLEQLVAESTGKGGRGVVPVTHEGGVEPRSCGADRVFVGLTLEGEGSGGPDPCALAAAGQPVLRLTLPRATALGGELFRWEAATALLGCALELNPFDQPDVQLAKELASRRMAGDREGEDAAGLAVDDPGCPAAVATWRGQAGPGDYLAIQAFLAPTREVGRSLDALRAALGSRGGLPTTLGWGPRFLHSTGQLHKGGPTSGLFLQLVDRPGVDVTVPESGFDFGRLIRAQADGDLAALQQRGRRVLRVHLGDDAAGGVERLASML